MKMFTFWKFLNASDYFSIANQMVIAAIMIALILLQIYFSVSVAPKLNAKAIDDRAELKKEVLEIARSDFKNTHKSRKKALKKRNTLIKMASLEASLAIECAKSEQ